MQLAGSIRRRADRVKDIDIVATTTRPEGARRAPRRARARSRASARRAAPARGRARTPASASTCASAQPGQLGNLLQHFTGSGRHNAALREAAVRRGLHVSEYGILDDATAGTDPYATEQEVYERLGLAYIEPELREDRGELEAARAAATACRG